MVGDVVGRVGRQMLSGYLGKVRERYGADFAVVNCENAAGGFGVTREVVEELFAAGADVLTSGNHVWHRPEGVALLGEEPHMLRPANYPEGTPGRGMLSLDVKGKPLAVINLMGRVFMPPQECPFRAADRLLLQLPPEVKTIVVDFHGEATSEKMAMGWFLDGRASAVVGTHTHVQTADERVLPRGTAYLTDVGMTGPADSVIGVKREAAIQKFLTGLPRRFEPASGEGQFNAALVEVDPATGRAKQMARINFRG